MNPKVLKQHPMDWLRYLYRRLMDWLRYLYRRLRRSLYSPIEHILFSSIKITLAIFTLICIFSLFLWIWGDDNGIIIMPSEIHSDQGYNGQSISDLLTYELMRIKEINQIKDTSYTSPIEHYNISTINRQDSTIDYRLSKVGMLGQRSFSISLGEILLTLKYLLPRNNISSTTLSTSLHSYGDKMVLVASLSRPQGLLACQVSSNSNCSKEEVTQLVRELAYQIAYNYCTKTYYTKTPDYASTWQTFANITQGWEAFQTYSSTGNLNHLETAKNMAIRAREWDSDYKGSIRLLNVVASEYLSKKQYPEAIETLNEAIKLDPNDAMIWNNKGIALGNQGNHSEAIKALDNATRLGPNNAKVWETKGWILENQGKHDEAIKVLDKAISLDPELATAWRTKGWILENQGKHDEAIKALDKTINLDPDDAKAWETKGWVLANQGKYDEAVKALDEAISLDPELATAWRTKGWVLKFQWTAPLRVDNELRNEAQLRGAHEEDKTALRPGVQDINSG